MSTLQPAFFITDMLSGLGFGQRVVVIASMVLGVLYLLKGKKAAGTFATTMGKLWLAGVSIFVAAALALALGWVSPDVDAFFRDLVTAVGFLYDLVRGPVVDFIRDIVSKIT